MSKQWIQKLILCLGMTLTSNLILAANLQETKLHTVKKNTQAEYALQQQKRNLSLYTPDNDQVKMINTLRPQPTQNFFANQHEQFSRFVQSFFQPHSS